MNTALRTLAAAFGLTATVTACSDDSKPVTDVLAEDSTLVREVMSANRDSFSRSFDTDNSTPDSVAATTPSIASPVATTPPTRIAPGQKSPSNTRRVVTGSASSSPRRRSVRTSQSRVASSSNTAPARSATTPSTRPETRIASESTRMKSSASIPAGTELILAADQRVCASMSRVGDKFQARIAEDLVGPIGVVIPKGTVATAQISSVRNDFDLDIASLTFGGHTYPIASDVTDADVEKVRTKSTKRTVPIAAGAGLGAAAGGMIGRDIKSAVIGAAGGAIAGALAARPSYRTDRCLPEGGRITTKLSEPLKIALTD